MSRLAAVRVANGDEAARREILRAIGKARGDRSAAAELLEVGETTLYRMIGDLELWERLDAYCREKGFPARAGRPRGVVPAAVRRKIRDGRRESLRG